MEAQFRYEGIIFWCDVMSWVGKPNDVLCKLPGFTVRLICPSL